jgi:WhiB family redox-sensing transcriptional regulator
MSRRLVLTAADRRRLHRDPRFQAALRDRHSDPRWRSRGRCLDGDPERFFLAAAEDPAPALAVCRTCSVAGPCLAAALDSGEVDGVWGATTPAERRPMRLVWLEAARGQRLSTPA